MLWHSLGDFDSVVVPASLGALGDLRREKVPFYSRHFPTAGYTGSYLPFASGSSLPVASPSPSAAASPGVQ